MGVLWIERDGYDQKRTKINIHGARKKNKKNPWTKGSHFLFINCIKSKSETSHLGFKSLNTAR